MAHMPTARMGPAARSFAADAHDCIMVRIQTDLPHTSVRREDARQWRAPLGSSRRQAPSDGGVRREKPISLFIVPPRAQASRRCETTSDAKAASRQAPLARISHSLEIFAGVTEGFRGKRVDGGWRHGRAVSSGALRQSACRSRFSRPVRRFRFRLQSVLHAPPGTPPDRERPRAWRV